jgi:TolA-binding protein
LRFNVQVTSAESGTNIVSAEGGTNHEVEMQKAILVSCLFLSSLAWAAIPKNMNSKKDNFPEGERLVYERVIQSYRKGDLVELNKQRKLLQDKYPTSAHIANAFYMTGALEYQQNHLGEALQAFDEVVNHFVQSSKRSTALFAMAMTYKKLGLPKQADAVFHRVIQLYPGSPDSKRAWMELRLSGAPAKAKG